jgi:hypothetical protein
MALLIATVSARKFFLCGTGFQPRQNRGNQPSLKATAVTRCRSHKKQINLLGSCAAEISRRLISFQDGPWGTRRSFADS